MRTFAFAALFAAGLCGAWAQIVNPPQGGGSWPVWAAVGASDTRTNLGLQSWATNTNTPLFVDTNGVVQSGTNAPLFPSNSAWWALRIGGTNSGFKYDNNYITFYRNGASVWWASADGFVTANRAQTRLNLGLGASWLTNSNVPTPYSGAAPTGAILAADGAGGSAFNSNISISTNGGFSFGASLSEQITLRAGTTQVINAKYDNTLAVYVNALQLGTAYGDNNAWLYREDWSMWGIRRFGGTNEQSVRIYGAYSNTNNYRRLNITAWTNGVTTIKPEGVGTGASNNFLHISGLPTNDPGISGVLWNDSGTVKVSP